MRTFLTGCLAAVALLSLAACSDGDGNASVSGKVPVQASAATTDISWSLEEVLEHGRLPGACEQWQADPDNRELLLRCGKYMFFYEGFDTPGAPLPLLQSLASNLPQHVGEGFAALGYFPDPYSAEKLPVGFGPTLPSGTVETRAFTCAGCHFGRTEGGLYVVGLPNHELQYGKVILYLFTLSNLVTGLGDLADYSPEVQASLAPVLAWLEANPEQRQALLLDIVTMGQQLLTSGGDLSLGAIRPETPTWWATWPAGVLDFFTSPFPEDIYHIPIRIPSLWDIPTPEEARALGLRSAMLTAAGGGYSLPDFVRGFVLTSKGDPAQWSDERIRPLVEYIYSLRPPSYRRHVGPLEPALVQRGERLFFTTGCSGCHDGKAYGGSDIFRFGPDDITARTVATDATLRYFADPELDGTLCCDLQQLGNSELTQGLKAPHLTGIWSHRRFLHNGSVASLEELLCYHGPRPAPSAIEGMDNSGHLFGCELPTADKYALLAFLKSL